MANKNNLIPQAHKLTVEEASKGGIQSGKARAQRKKLRQELEILLSEGDCQKKICLAIIDLAIKGNTKAFEVIRDTIGEKNISDFDLNFPPLIFDDINPFSGLTTEELRILAREEHEKGAN